MNAIKGIGIAIFAFVIIFIIIPKIFPSNPDNSCISLSKKIIDMTSKREIKIISIDNIKTEINLTPTSIELPGKIVLACSGVAYTHRGDKGLISFFETRKGEIVNSEHFIGYEEN